MGAGAMIPTSELLRALPVAVYTTDAEGRVTFYNEAAAELWGQCPEIGKDLWRESWRLYRADGSLLPYDECPMAIALKEGRAVRGIEAILERPDGGRVPFLSFPTPLRNESGGMVGAVNVLIDLSAQKKGAMDSARLAAIVSSSDDAIISKNLAVIIQTWNAGAERIFGFRESEMIGQSILRIIPPELQDEEGEILAKIQAGERIGHYETIRVAKDGRLLNISLTVSPLRDATGTVVGASKVARDITQQKRAQEVQTLLLQELSHRVKNTLATVQSIAHQTLRNAEHPYDFATAFSGRIQALAKAHTLLTQNTWQGTQMAELVRDQITLGSSDDERVSCSGPALLLDPQTALHLALVLHELATNARKYGSLSVPQGRLSVEWSVESNGTHWGHLHWKERGGPEVLAPSEFGFGTTLIEQSLRSDGGTGSIRYEADGVSCHIKFPLRETIRLQHGRDVRGRTSGLEVVSPANRSSADSLHGKNILIIEDEPLIMMDIEASLERSGCRIAATASSTEEAIRSIEKKEFDAALVDANLGGEPVDEIAIALTQRNIPFAFVTGYGREALPPSFRGGIVLDKPFTQEQLLTTVTLLLHRNAEVKALRQ